jgi:phytoene synthase
MPDDAASLARSHAWCRESTRRHAKSFYFASFPLPPEKRRAAYAIYAFCRHADDLVDEAGAGADVAAAVRELEQTFDAITRDGRRDWPFAAAFAEAVGRFGLEKEPFAELVEGVGRDQGRVRIANWEELRDYCYHVASVVGLVLCPVFGLSDPSGRERAIDLGIAMQLTNILRDVGEDLERDRIYLPADELAAHGLDEAYLRRRLPDAAWRKFLDHQIERARAYYSRADEGIPLLANDGSRLTVRLMRDIYADILHQLEKIGGDSLNRRAYTPFHRKLRLAARSWLRNRSNP